MITITRYTEIAEEVLESLNETFDYIRYKCQDHNYVLFLAEADYKNEYRTNYQHHRLSPYIIDNRVDRYKDASRLNFFIDYLRAFYSWPLPIIKTEDTDFQITLEMMMYTHIWESKPFLRQLYRLAYLVTGKSYPWDVVVPEMSKHTFIRNDTRNVLASKNLKLASVISKGFHTSLRNAFAHSEYRFDDYHKCIHLDTYKGEPWDIDRISYNDWTERFAYSALLSYYLLDVMFQRRKSLVSDFGRNQFIRSHPITTRKFRALDIYYDEVQDNFSFDRL